MVKMNEETNMLQRCRNDALLNAAYTQGQIMGLDELEILKRFTLILLDLKDEAFQEKVNALMNSPRHIIK